MRDDRLTSKGPWFPILPILGIVLALQVLYIGTVFRWWFEDDPYQFYWVSTIHNPVEFFTNPAFSRAWGAGNAVTPMQMVSYWLDVRLFGFDAMAAYCHSVIALLAATALIYATLYRWTKSELVSAWACLLWALLPSTIVVTQYLSARHYLEGFFFGLAVCFLTQELKPEFPKGRRMLVYCGIFVAAIAAMLSKEIYAATVPAYLFAFGVATRRYACLGLSVVLVAGYAIYRSFLVGSGVAYGMSLIGPTAYIKFLLVLPYTFSASPTGYFVLAAFIAAVFMVRRSGSRSSLGMFLIVLSSALVALYPVAGAVLETFRTPGTWYRAPFILNTLFVLWGALLISRIEISRFQRRTVILVLILAMVLPGTELTREYWSFRMARAKVEGEFYLHNPTKLVFSEEAAYWYLPGLGKMYGEDKEHYISKLHLTDDRAKEMLASFPTIYRFDGANFVPDRELYHMLRARNALPPKRDD